MTKTIILLLSITTLISGCNSSGEKDKYTVVSNDLYDVDLTIEVPQENDSYILMKTNCYACHNPKAKSHDDILAPPFKAVKMHYVRAYDTKEEFVDAMVNWIQNPDEQNALMPGAVKRFKVMPKLPLPTEDLEKIASYIYDNNIEEPVWMEEHMKGKKGRM
ncbi:c-type cytochrome [Gelidibacter japonicus]|uniref:c-type cytochrome n=1 Tax=Gelidibacter japonicus TaxID=1962232 RepID=UPI003A901850